MRTGHGVAAGLFGLATGLWIGACSGDTSSTNNECGGRGQARCPASSGAGAGASNGGGGDGASGSAAPGFGNTDAGAPVLTMRDAGPPGPGETVDPDDRMCGGLAIEPELEMETIPGNILLIFDKSGSMCQTWGPGLAAKWQDAHQAIAAAIEPLEENVTVGSIFFPDTLTGNTCFVPPITSAPQVDFMDGAAFLAAWQSYWTTATSHPSLCQNRTANPVNGATPLLGALQVADSALTASPLDNTTNVVIITDGEPNCSGGDSNADEPLANLTPLIETWLAAGIRTHVVGLPGVAAAVPLLDGLAAAGGTTQHIPANDPAALQTELAKIVGESVTSTFNSCRIGLPEQPPNPDDVHVLVVENGLEQDVGRDLGTGGGWAMAADGSEIVLQGLLCDLAQQGQYEKISIVFGCVEAPPLEPPVPPE